MRSCTCWWASLQSWPNCEGVAHSIYADFAAEGAGGVYEPVASFFVGVREGEARHSCVCFGTLVISGLDQYHRFNKILWHAIVEFTKTSDRVCTPLLFGTTTPVKLKLDDSHERNLDHGY